MFRYNKHDLQQQSGPVRAACGHPHCPPPPHPGFSVLLHPIPPPLGVGRGHKAGGSTGASWMKGTCPAERRPAQTTGAGPGLALPAARGWHHYMPTSVSHLLKLFSYEIYNTPAESLLETKV